MRNLLFDHYLSSSIKKKSIKTPIVFTGPESTAKTTLAVRLAIYIYASYVPEYARFYIDQLNRPYNQADLLKIAQGQLALQHAVLLNTSKQLICDTDLLTIKIWSEYTYGHCPNWITEHIQESSVIYFLCNVDIPWTADSQREHPNNRIELYHLYKDHLMTMGKEFVEISGQGEERWKIVRQMSEKLLQN